MESLGEAYTVALLVIAGVAIGLVGCGVLIGYWIWG